MIWQSLDNSFHRRLAGNQLLEVNHPEATKARKILVGIEGWKPAEDNRYGSLGAGDWPVQAEIAPGLPTCEGARKQALRIGPGAHRGGREILSDDGTGRTLNDVAELAGQAGDHVPGVRLPQEANEGRAIEPACEIGRQLFGCHGLGCRSDGRDRCRCVRNDDRGLGQWIARRVRAACERRGDGNQQGAGAGNAHHGKGDLLFAAIDRAAKLLDPACCARAQTAVELEQAGEGRLLTSGDPQGKALFIARSKQKAGSGIGAHEPGWADRQDEGRGALGHGGRKGALRERGERLGTGWVLVHAQLVHREALSSGTIDRRSAGHDDMPPRKPGSATAPSLINT